MTPTPAKNGRINRCAPLKYSVSNPVRIIVDLTGARPGFGR
jgi:hypothetical protein